MSTHPGEIADDEDAKLKPGTRLGKYEIIRALSSGGMGTVYEAVHGDIGKRVACKVLSPAVAAVPGARTRFLREAQLTSKVRHPHIVDVTDMGSEGANTFLVMELLRGEDLAQRVTRMGPLSAGQLVDIMLPVCSAVVAAHQAGITHRDLKPQNIFLAEGPHGVQPKVLDFGISKGDDGLATNALTGTGTTIGTPYYIAPEQILNSRAAGPASDQYAVGVILYECLTGVRPFDGDNLFVVFQSIVAGTTVRPRDRRPDLAPAMEAVVLRAMHLDPRQRYESVQDLGRAMLPFASDRVRLLWQDAFQPSPGATRYDAWSDAPRQRTLVDSGSGGTPPPGAFRTTPLPPSVTPFPPSPAPGGRQPTTPMPSNPGVGTPLPRGPQGAASPWPPPSASGTKVLGPAPSPAPGSGRRAGATPAESAGGLRAQPHRPRGAGGASDSGIGFSDLDAGYERPRVWKRAAIGLAVVAAGVVAAVVGFGLTDSSKPKRPGHDDERTSEREGERPRRGSAPAASQTEVVPVPAPPEQRDPTPASPPERRRPEIPRTFAVSVTADPDAARFELDGVPAGVGRITRALPLDQTRHTLRVTAEGYDEQTIEFTDAAPPTRVTLVKRRVERTVKPPPIARPERPRKRPPPSAAAATPADDAPKQAPPPKSLNPNGAPVIY
jgi:eukaryotic-like serine/threonine-protein kinase